MSTCELCGGPYDRAEQPNTCNRCAEANDKLIFEFRARVVKAEASVLELRAEVERLRERLQFDPGGSDKIDELEQASQFDKAEIARLMARIVMLERVVDMVLQTATTPPELLALASQAMPSVCCAPNWSRKPEAS